MCGFLPPPPPHPQPLFPTPASLDALSKEKKRLDSNYLADVMVLAFIMLLPRVMLLAVLWCYLLTLIMLFANVMV